MARPRKPVDVAEIARLRCAGLSWPEIARRTGRGYGTVYRAHYSGLDSTAPIQNPKGAAFSIASTRKSVPEATVEEIKRWRQTEYEAGRPSGLQDFFASTDGTRCATTETPSERIHDAANL